MHNRRKNQLPYSKQSEYLGLDEEDVTELRNAFRLFDTDKDGKIDPKQLISTLYFRYFINLTYHDDIYLFQPF